MRRRAISVAVAAALAVGVGAGVVVGGGQTTTRHVTHVVHRPPKLQTPLHGENDVPQGLNYTGCSRGRCVKKVTSPRYRPASGCGVERWAVKTMTDPGANSVNLTPRQTTVAALDGIAPPLNPTDRVAPTETTTWTIKAHMDAFKIELDSDIHLAVHDDAGNTMIVEFPAASCDTGSVVKAQVDLSRTAFLEACQQPTGRYQKTSGVATITGVGFFDRIHGQRGVAPNGIELHPVTRFIGTCQ